MQVFKDLLDKFSYLHDKNITKYSDEWYNVTNKSYDNIKELE